MQVPPPVVDAEVVDVLLEAMVMQEQNAQDKSGSVPPSPQCCTSLPQTPLSDASTSVEGLLSDCLDHSAPPSRANSLPQLQIGSRPGSPSHLQNICAEMQAVASLPSLQTSGLTLTGELLPSSSELLTLRASQPWETGRARQQKQQQSVCHRDGQRLRPKVVAGARPPTPPTPPRMASLCDRKVSKREVDKCMVIQAQLAGA